MLKRIEISLTITCCSEEMDSSAFWITLQPIHLQSQGKYVATNTCCQSQLLVGTSKLHEIQTQ